MVNRQEHQRIVIDLLHSRYRANGYITEDDFLKIVNEQSLSLAEQDQVMDQLLARGVLIKDESDNVDDLEDNYDRTRTDYNEVFKRVIEIDPGLTNFIDEVRIIQAPQHREWINLLPQAKSGNKYAYQRIFDMYLRIVVKIALWYHDKYDAPLADGIQDGCIGLMKAIEKFDFGKHDLFTTYAPQWILQNISRGFMDTERIIRVPVHVLEEMRKINGISARLFEELGREALLEEIAIEYGDSIEKVSQILKQTQEAVSLDAFDENELSKYCIHEEDIIEKVDRSLFRRQLNKFFQELTVREKRVLKLRFGLNSEIEMTLEEVGQIEGVTRERIRQIELKTLRKLKEPIYNRKLKDFFE